MLALTETIGAGRFAARHQLILRQQMEEAVTPARLPDTA
jgi:hypothetical protein